MVHPKQLRKSLSILKISMKKKNAPKETIKEFQRRYKLIGGSPLVKITQEQAAALEKELNERKTGKIFQVVAGMRFSHPFINKVIKENAEDAEKIIGIIMSPQYSPIIMNGYIKELSTAVNELKNKSVQLTFATDWHAQPYFLNALAEKVKQAISTFPTNVQKHVIILFSVHSMPKRIIDKEPSYINDLKDTAAKVAKLVGLPKKRWMFCYQSAGHTPEEWLKPDFADIMPVLKAKGETHVLIAPVQFLADHLEILYDVGIGAREQAENQGIQFARTESLNTSPLFIKALAEIALKK